MATNTIECKIRILEKEIDELKCLLENSNNKKKDFSSLANILSGKTNLTLKEIQSFKYRYNKKGKL